MPETSTQPPLLAALAQGVGVADGAMGTMIQARDLTLADFEGNEGCNEILNVTRPDVIRAIQAAYTQAAAGRRGQTQAQVAMEPGGTMLLGSGIGAALTALEPLGIDLNGLNGVTGPAEMSEHLLFLSRHARVEVSVMPNAGLPVLGLD